MENIDKLNTREVTEDVIQALIDFRKSYEMNKSEEETRSDLEEYKKAAEWWPYDNVQKIPTVGALVADEFAANGSFFELLTEAAKSASVKDAAEKEKEKIAEAERRKQLNKEAQQRHRTRKKNTVLGEHERIVNNAREFYLKVSEERNRIREEWDTAVRVAKKRWRDARAAADAAKRAKRLRQKAVPAPPATPPEAPEEPVTPPAPPTPPTEN